MALTRRRFTAGSAGTFGLAASGLFGDYSFSPQQHNGYPTDEVVMSAANSQHNGAYALAPGYA